MPALSNFVGAAADDSLAMLTFRPVSTMLPTLAKAPRFGSDLPRAGICLSRICKTY